MDRFGSDMQSGDHFKIQAALQEASEKTFAAMQGLGYIDSGGNLSPDHGLLVIVVVAAFAVVFIPPHPYVAAAVAAALAYYWYFPNSPGGPEPTETEGSLYQEMLVNSMSDRLATTP